VSTDPRGGLDGPSAGGAPGQPSEEEIRAAYEAELSRITTADVILQTTVSLLNLGSRRLGVAQGAGGERDLGQVREAIDGVRALLGILERSAPKELRPLRDALAQLQMAYAREAQAPGDDDPSSPKAPAAEKRDAPVAEGKTGEPTAEDKQGPGPAESSGRLWVPGR
jgi:hypothetical protein